jgi:hypothetical protein
MRCDRGERRLTARPPSRSDRPGRSGALREPHSERDDRDARPRVAIAGHEGGHERPRHQDEGGDVEHGLMVGHHDAGAVSITPTRVRAPPGPGSQHDAADDPGGSRGLPPVGPQAPPWPRRGQGSIATRASQSRSSPNESAPAGRAAGYHPREPRGASGRGTGRAADAGGHRGADTNRNRRGWTPGESSDHSYPAPSTVEQS